ncbi:MAG: hypothetical protein LBS99_00240 [Clostridiales bacterium]|jgi:hypothetical protein|nr:hypothetical protein [Clostridiales bacterium]
MADIIISSKESFDNVVFLIENSVSVGDIAYDGKANKIKSGGDYFVLAGQDKTAIGYEESRRDPNGGDKKKSFTRFDILDPEKRKARGTTQTWDTFLSEVLNSFYKKYSYLVYETIENASSEQLHKRIMRRLFDTAVPEISGSLDFDKNAVGSESCIYEVAVKFKMRLGGEPVSVINKFYLIVMPDSSISLFPADRAAGLNNQIRHKARTANKQPGKPPSSADALPAITSEKVDELISVIKRLLNGEDGFQAYLVGEAREQYDKFLETQAVVGEASASGIEIDCDGAQLRYISYLKLMNQSYFCRDGATGKLMFKVDFGINNELTVACANCNEIIIDAKSMSPDDKPVREYFADNEQAEISKNDYAAVRRHCSPVSCDLGFGRACKKLVCLNKVTSCPKCKKTICCDCLYDSVVTAYSPGGVASTEYLHTPCLSFCYDTLTALPAEKTRECPCCKKRYSSTNFAGSAYCRFCASVIGAKPNSHGVTEPRLNALYQKHKDMLPFGLRRKKNICNENATMILFGVAKKRRMYYRLFDKNAAATDKTYLRTFKVTKIKGDKNNGL